MPTRYHLNMFTALWRGMRTSASSSEAEHRLRLLSDIIPAMVWIMTSEGTGEHFNESWARYTGMTLARSRGFGWMAAVHPDDLAASLIAWRQAVEDGTPYLHEVRYRRHDGVFRWHVVRALLVPASEGLAGRWVGVATDIHEQKETEAALRRLTEERRRAEERILHLLKEAEQREHELHEKQTQLVQAAKLASIGELATGVAHEINNPLNNIGLIVGNMIDAARGRYLDQEAVVSNLQVTMAQVDRAARIVDQLRRFGRMSTSERLPVDMNEVVRSSLALIGEQLRLRGIRVTHHCAPDPIVRGNPLELEQVLVNLIANARDAVADSSKKDITLRTVVDADTVSVEVRDTGCGMSEEVQGRIFDPFFTTKEVGKGTGLGLSLSYGIMKDHHGRIALTSRPGEGATFILTFPRAPGADAEAAVMTGTEEPGRCDS